MPIPQQFASIALSLSLVLFQATPAVAARQVDSCPPGLNLEAKQRLAQLEGVRQNIGDLMSGELAVDTPLAALFAVDLNNETAVANRIKELQALKAEGRGSADSSAAYRDCAKAGSALATLVEKLDNQQLLLDQQRLEFLALPQDSRRGVINALNVRKQQVVAVAGLAEERSAADKLQNEAVLSGASAEERAKSAASQDLREIAAQRVLLEKARETLARLQAEMVAELQERVQFYQRTSDQLSVLTAETLKGAAAKPLPEVYRESVAIWRELVDRVFERIAVPEKSVAVPDIPQLPDELLARLKGTAEEAQYLSAYRETEALKAELERSRLQRFEQGRNDLYQLLQTAGQMRSSLMQQNLQAGNDEILKVSSEYFQDIGREIRIVPYRVLAIFYSKALDFRHKASAGIDGWLDIARQSFNFLLLVAVFFAAYTGLHRVSSALERLRNHLVREKYNHAYARTLAHWIRRGNVYVPWVIMLLAVYIAEDLVAGTAITQIGLILPYIAFYLWYRISLNLALSIMGLVAFSGSIQSSMAEKQRLLRTVRLVGIFFFVLIAILHATQDAVGEALVYRLVYGFVVYVGIVVCAYAAREWQPEIAAAAKELLPERIHLGISRLGKNGLWSWFISLPALLLLIVTRLAIRVKKWAGEFDFFKRISAALFLRRIEHANKSGGQTDAANQQPPQLSQDYLRWFKLEDMEDKTLLIELESDLPAEIKSILSAWSDNSSLDHSLALYGEKGCGKSSLLDMIEMRYEKCAVRRINIPPKLITREAVLGFFGKELGMDLSLGAESLLKADEGKEDAVLLIDNAQNLFLGQLGGFEGYRTFAELMNSGTEHLFWCVTFNLRSWHYLRAVFGGMPLFRRAIEIEDFSEKDIMNLIVARHQRTDAKLAYDDIIRATQSEDDLMGEHQVEKQFFRLLWGQSNGNPRAALMLWTASLTPLSDDRMKVGLPKYPKIIINEKWGDEALFVYAAIMRHENLTQDEVVAVTNLPENIVINALGTGYDGHLLDCGTDGRYRITAIAQASVTRLLLGKNFIYE
ncbi:MAG: hypothetical protein KKH12_07425 [Gammaproteobacteria bacterium]|nr:hypothetical protein [Gammaproteobacteria bacterium]MBU1481490.1 hypothetical protein [Gammaproteobacteria bacterium]